LTINTAVSVSRTKEVIHKMETYDISTSRAIHREESTSSTSSTNNENCMDCFFFFF